MQKKSKFLPIFIFLAMIVGLTVYSLYMESPSTNMVTTGDGGSSGKYVKRVYCSRKQAIKCDTISRKCVDDSTGGHCGAPLKTPKPVVPTSTQSPNNGSCKYQTIIGSETYYIKVGTCLTVFRQDTHRPYWCLHNNGTKEIISYKTASQEDINFGRNFNGRCEAGTSIAIPCCNPNYSITLK